MTSFTEAFNEHRKHVLDNLYAPIKAGRYTMSIPEPKVVKGCPFCEHPDLADKFLEGVDETLAPPQPLRSPFSRPYSASARLASPVAACQANRLHDAKVGSKIELSVWADGRGRESNSGAERLLPEGHGAE